MKRQNKLIWTSIVTAIGASLCCIIPVLALISGATGFSWLEPLRLYLIGLTAIVLVFTLYQKLKPKKQIDCDCETEEKPSFMQSKTFLFLITVFVLLTLAFPYYSHLFYSQSDKEIIAIEKANIGTINIDIDGMTCMACEDHINYSVNELHGVLIIKSSFESGKAIIEFDKSKTDVNEIKEAINSTGYRVVK